MAVRHIAFPAAPLYSLIRSCFQAFPLNFKKKIDKYSIRSRVLSNGI